MIPDEIKELTNAASSYDRLSTALGVLNIILVIATAIVTIATFHVGNKLSDAKEKVSDRKIADAKNNAAEANLAAKKAEVKAATAEEGAAHANQAAEELRKANLLLRKDLAQTQADAQVEKQKLAGMEVEVETARKQRIDAQRKLLELEERLKFRKLTPEQVAILTKLLNETEKGPLSVAFLANDMEGESYADQFIPILRSAGWKITRETIQDQRKFDGIALVVNDPGNLPPYLANLINIVRKAGLEIITAHPIIWGDKPILFIGPRPIK